MDVPSRVAMGVHMGEFTGNIPMPIMEPKSILVMFTPTITACTAILMIGIIIGIAAIIGIGGIIGGMESTTIGADPVISYLRGMRLRSGLTMGIFGSSSAGATQC